MKQTGFRNLGFAWGVRSGPKGPADLWLRRPPQKISPGGVRGRSKVSGASGGVRGRPGRPGVMSGVSGIPGAS